MSREDFYAGPAVGPNRGCVDEVRERIERNVHIRSSEIHRAAVQDWAKRDDGSFPSATDAAAEARDELQVLINGLGKWAAVRSADLPKTSGKSTRYDTPDWEWDLLR
jgi:hypothetical protein